MNEKVTIDIDEFRHMIEAAMMRCDGELSRSDIKDTMYLRGFYCGEKAGLDIARKFIDGLANNE